MLPFHRPRAWREPPIAVQILALLLGGLVVAQLVTLLLTLVLPPAPPMQHGIADIVATLRGHDAGRLRRRVQAAAPDVGGPGWFTSDPARRDLARRLRADVRDVRLAFYAPLPFAGITAPPPMPAGTTRIDALRPVAWQVSPEPLAAQPETMVLLAQYGPPLGGGFPGGSFPGGARPGGRGGFPGGERQGSSGAGRGGLGGRGDWMRQDRSNPGRIASPRDLDAQPIGPIRDLDEPLPPPLPAPAPAEPAPPIVDLPPPVAVAPRPTEQNTPPVIAIPAPVESRPAAIPPAPRRTPTPEARPLPIAPTARALFGFAPAPFVEGDFVAALRLPDGRWAVVQPQADGFPTPWQRRVILWFAIAFALVAPLAWLYARHIVRPLAAFTVAAEQLGRDPSAALVALEGPAEIGRAAHAFNVMQSRLRSFVDDRTAMVGAISHDLRTPLTRLRFRIEEVDDDAIRDGMTGEVEEMEAMIASVLSFIRDASTPNARERLDLGMLVEDVAQDAAVTGGDVTIETIANAPVDIDVLGIRRLLANLVENAVKYGVRARIRLAVSDDAAIAEIRDDGPGVPEDEIERAFEPFYRASNAAASGKDGTGLGLAVCRSIARAHGGDVRLLNSAEGFAAELRLPLAYDAVRAAA